MAAEMNIHPCLGSLSHYDPQLLFITCFGAVLQLEKRAQKLIPLTRKRHQSLLQFDDKTNLLTAFISSFK